MADTKKEHYVPRCYLENFEDDNKRIKVYDKTIMQERSQLKSEIAAENYFYDIDFEKMMEKIEPDKHQAIINDIKKITGIDDWDSIKSTIMKTKYIEKDFFGKIEGEYSTLLKDIIKKSYNGNKWVIENCHPFSENDKILLALLLSVQIIRTRAYRDIIKQTIEKGYQALINKQLTRNENSSPNETFQVMADDSFIKLQHSSMLLNDEIILNIAETLMNHIWVMYVNKTDCPFYTSDNPVVTIAHKHDKYRSYNGLASEGVEVVFPVSPNLLISMYEKTYHSKYVKDRTFIPIYDKICVDYYNSAQVSNSFRCVFSQKENFELAKIMCKKHPEIRDYSNKITVE